MAGALGVGALVSAFYLGGRVSAGAVAERATVEAPLAATTAVVATENTTDELAVECEPGQRAVVHAATAGRASRVTCVTDARPVARVAGDTYTASSAAPQVVRVADVDDRPYARPAVITQPVEVYRPRARTASYDTRSIERPRSVKKSVAIIGGSTAAGAVVGGLVKGGKGAVIGGLLGGGAATVWDQVTRRRDADVR
ncbi:MAG: hypothetical protein U0P30_00490 [Vicinamibacterales bacterium]